MTYSTFLKKLNCATYINYLDNTCSETNLDKFKLRVLNEIGVKLDTQYLSFLREINGFDVNSLCWYGTEKNDKFYVQSSIEQNLFWLQELKFPDGTFILGDGDMDFYCYNQNDLCYYILSKADLDIIHRFETFQDLIEELSNIYFH